MTDTQPSPAGPRIALFPIGDLSQVKTISAILILKDSGIPIRVAKSAIEEMCEHGVAYIDKVIAVTEKLESELRLHGVGVAIVDQGRSIGLAARIAMCKGGPIADAEREWIDAPAVGREKI